MKEKRKLNSIILHFFVLFFIVSQSLAPFTFAQDSSGGGINLTTETFVMGRAGAGGVFEMGPNDRLALAVAHEKLSIEEKARAVAKLIKTSASRDTPLNVVIDIDPIGEDPKKTPNPEESEQLLRKFFEALAYQLEDEKLLEKLVTKKVKVNFSFVSSSTIKKAQELLFANAEPEIINKRDQVFEYRDSPKELLTEIVTFNKDSDVFLIGEEIPRYDIENFLRETVGPKDVWKSMKTGLKATVDFAIPKSPIQLAVATTLTYMGVNTLGPSWVYISMGEFTTESISTLILSTILLYSIPRHENATKIIHQSVYEFFRNGFYSFPLVNRAYMLTLGHKNSKIFTSAVLSGLYGVGIAATFQSLREGEIIFNNHVLFMDLVLRNGMIIALANSPWTFISHRLKTRGLISPSLVTLLRTSQLIGIGYASSTGLAIGPGASIWPINSIEEILLVGMGALGIGDLITETTLKIAHNLNSRIWFEYINRNVENFIRNIEFNASPEIGLNLTLTPGMKAPKEFKKLEKPLIARELPKKCVINF